MRGSYFGAMQREASSRTTFNCIFSSLKKSTQYDDMFRRCRRIQLFDQFAATLQYRALVDRALVGDFAAIDGERRVQQDSTCDPGRRTGGGRKQPSEAFGKGAANQRIGRGRGNVIGGKGRIDQAAAVKVEHDQRRYFVAIDAGNHDVAHQRRAGCDETRAQGTDADPGAARELEILGNAAIEVEAGVEIVRLSRLERIAEPVEAFLVEGLAGQFHRPPVAGRHVRSPGTYFELAVARHELCLVAGNGK